MRPKLVRGRAGAGCSSDADADGEALTARLTRWSVERLALPPGRPVYAVIKSIAFDSRSLSEAPRRSGAAAVESTAT